MKRSIGTMSCLCCAQEIPAKAEDGKAVSVSCQWCDLSAYAKHGTDAYRRIMARVKRSPDAAVVEPQPVKSDDVKAPPKGKQGMPWIRQEA